MNELITRLTEKAGISADQASKAIDTIKDFIKEKFPMMAGAVDNLFASAPEATEAVVNQAIPNMAGNESFLDKISDVIPGENGQKLESFAKDAAHKAEDAFDNVKEKLSGFFSGDKK